MAVTFLPVSEAGTVVWPSSFQPQAATAPLIPDGGTPAGAACAVPAVTTPATMVSAATSTAATTHIPSALDRAHRPALIGLFLHVTDDGTAARAQTFTGRTGTANPQRTGEPVAVDRHRHVRNERPSIQTAPATA